MDCPPLAATLPHFTQLLGVAVKANPRAPPCGVAGVAGGETERVGLVSPTRSLVVSFPLGPGAWCTADVLNLGMKKI